MKHIAAMVGILLILLASCLASASAAECWDVWVEAEDITTAGNSTKYFYFPVYNDSEEQFDVYEVVAYKEDSDSPFTVSVTDYPSEIDAEGQGEITLKVKASGVDAEEIGEAYIKIGGYFDDGTYCSFGDIGKFYFDVTVEKEGDGIGKGECRDIVLHAEDVYIDEGKRGTYSFSIENLGEDDFELYGIEVEDDSPYFDATLYSKPSSIAADDSRDFRVKIAANRVSRDRQDTVELRARGKFEHGVYCSYSDPDEERFTVFVENVSPGTEPDYWEGDECAEISLDDRVVRVEQGSTVYTTFYLENHASENFLIDYVSVFDNSSNFVAEENGYGKVVKPDSVSYVNVVVRAYDEATPGVENAFVEVRGHFQNQESCYISGDGLNAFPVIIEERAAFPEPAEFEPLGCAGFSLAVPEEQEIGTTGSIPITIDNRTGARATIRLQGAGLSVNPALISVPKHSTVAENISVSSKLQQSTLLYSIEALGCKTEKRTEITAAGAQQQPQPESPAKEQTPAEDLIQGMANAVSTGFVVLGENLTAAGLVIVIVALLYLILRH